MAATTIALPLAAATALAATHEAAAQGAKPGVDVRRAPLEDVRLAGK
jgi:hypothetical protein